MKIYHFIYVILAIRFSMILGGWWKFNVCVTDSLSFECGTNKYWNIRSKVKMVIISESIVSWDARISNYTTTALPQGSVGCNKSSVRIHIARPVVMVCTWNVHNAIQAQTQVYLNLHGWVITPPQRPVRSAGGAWKSNFISQYFVRCDCLSIQWYLQNSARSRLTNMD